MSELRARLALWIERARAGEEVVVTDRGTPVARLVPVDSAPLLEKLTREGVLNPARSTERPAAHDGRRERARGSVSELVGDQRR